MANITVTEQEDWDQTSIAKYIIPALFLIKIDNLLQHFTRGKDMMTHITSPHLTYFSPYMLHIYMLTYKKTYQSDRATQESAQQISPEAPLTAPHRPPGR